MTTGAAAAGGAEGCAEEGGAEVEAAAEAEEVEGGGGGDASSASAAAPLPFAAAAAFRSLIAIFLLVGVSKFPFLLLRSGGRACSL